MNNAKKIALQDGDYDSKFNLFLRTYFSFPTPSSGKFSGVDGIREIFGREIFRVRKEFEAARFEEFIRTYNLKNVICFHKLSAQEIKKHFPKLNIFHLGPTRVI